VPFAVTPDQRQGPDMLVRFHYAANLAGGEWSHAQKLDKDPRPSLQERYGTHDGYVTAVTKAANNAVAKGYLLQDDATALITQAQNSDVLNSNKNTSCVAANGSSNCVAAYGEASITEPSGIGPLTAYPQDELQLGYSFNVGKVSASTVTFTRPQIILHATCTDSKGGPSPASGALNDVNGGTIVVTLPDASYPTNGGVGGWIPANNPHSDDSFQLTTTVPDLCQGGQMRIDRDATFTATVGTK
jgi:hypothetical protein